MAKRARFRLTDKTPPAPPKRKVGRPSKYNPAFVKIARNLCAHGATDAILADSFGVAISNVRSWYSMYPEFGEAVAEGKALVFDPLVERSLAQRAVGYSVDTEEIKIVDKQVVRVPIRKHFPPDTTACIFWLKNRQPDKWRDVYNHDHSGEVQTANLSVSQLREEIAKECERLGIVPGQLGELLANGGEQMPPDKSKH